jgi:hypothetical protein
MISSRSEPSLGESRSLWKYIDLTERSDLLIDTDVGICKPVRTLQQEAAVRYVISWPRVPIVFVNP